jgi:hypothetical protein
MPARKPVKRLARRVAATVEAATVEAATVTDLFQIHAGT